MARPANQVHSRQGRHAPLAAAHRAEHRRVDPSLAGHRAGHRAGVDRSEAAGRRGRPLGGRARQGRDLRPAAGLTAHPEWGAAWRLFIVTGFLGGLTTFSAFSGEVALLLQQGRLMLAGGAMALHLGGSLLLTLAGFATVEAFRRGG